MVLCTKESAEMVSGMKKGNRYMLMVILFSRFTTDSDFI
jgi:hypothetical protein